MTASDAVNSKSIFEDYELLARTLAGSLSKARAIELSEQTPSGVISPASICSLHQSLSNANWLNNSGKNWAWRADVPKHAKRTQDSDEVALERALTALDLAHWTCQMSTASGIQGPYLNKRRAIDLVRFIGEGRYGFVELKVDSDNPLYAAFEILGYALAYLHARTSKWRGTGRHDVFAAERIELTVLGPARWYKYRRRGGSEDREFDLKWLAKEIAGSLNAFVADTLKDKLTFSMAFRRFSGEGNADRQAHEINQLALKEWWKDASLA